jgi:hypothetical protein
MATPILSQPTTISQFQLARYATLANQLEALKAEQSALQQQLIAALSSGAQVEAGARSASLKACERRSVSWRSVVERLKGAGYASRILSCTKPTTYTKLVVR